MTEEQVQSSMNIILNAGDARLHCMKALDSITNYDFETAAEELKKAKDFITEAHKIQTNVISAETNGEKTEYSVLFAHAQDTLMTVYSEINIAKKMVKIFESYEIRLSAIENDKKE